MPLSSEALRVVNLARPFDRDGHLFPGLRKGVISDMTMGQHMRKADLPYRPHGFADLRCKSRSSQLRRIVDIHNLICIKDTIFVLIQTPSMAIVTAVLRLSDMILFKASG